MGICHSKPDAVGYKAMKNDAFFSSIQSEIGYAKSDVVSLSTEIWTWDVGRLLPAHEFWDHYDALIHSVEGEHDQRARELLPMLNNLQQELDGSVVSGYDTLVSSYNPVTHEYDPELLKTFCRGPLTKYVSNCTRVLNY